MLVRAAKAAGPATLTGTSYDVSVTGGYDPGHQLAALRFPVEIADRTHMVEARRTGETVFFERGAADANVIALAGPKGLAVRPAQQLPWVEVPAKTALQTIGPINPIEALESLAARDAKLTDVGPGPHGARRYRVEPQHGPPRNVLAPLSPFAVPVENRAHLTIVVDRDHRILKWISSAGPAHRPTTITVIYGAAPVWPAPARDQIFVGTGPAHPDGPFAPLHSGNDSGVQWALERAPGTLGTTCWRVRTTPPSHGAYGAAMDDGYCVLPPATGDTNVDMYAEFPFFAGAGSPLEVVVMLTPNGSVVSADAQLVGGHTAPARVYAAEGVVLFVGNADAPVWAMAVTDSAGVHDCSPYVYNVDVEAPTSAADAIGYRAAVPIACLERFNQRS